MGDRDCYRLTPGINSALADFAHPVDPGPVGLSGDDRGPIRAFIDKVRCARIWGDELGDLNVGCCCAPAQYVVAGCRDGRIGFNVGRCERRLRYPRQCYQGDADGRSSQSAALSSRMSVGYGAGLAAFI